MAKTLRPPCTHCLQYTANACTAASHSAGGYRWAHTLRFSPPSEPCTDTWPWLLSHTFLSKAAYKGLMLVMKRVRFFIRAVSTLDTRPNMHWSNRVTKAPRSTHHFTFGFCQDLAVSGCANAHPRCWLSWMSASSMQNSKCRVASLSPCSGPLD